MVSFIAFRYILAIAIFTPHFNQTINRQISNFDQLCLTPKAFIYFFLVKMLLSLPKLRSLYALMQIVFQIGGFQLSILYF